MVDPPPLVRPVAGPVASRYAYDRAAPFRRGARRVVRFRVPAGSPVRAPCAGRVSHAGTTPGGPAVAVRCGAWSVTLTGTVPHGVRRGQPVDPGARVGRARTTTVGLGLRRAADPFGYVDPLPHVGDPAPARRFTPLGPPPRGAPDRAPALSPRPAPAPAPGIPPVAPRPSAPVAAWVGLVVAALGLPAGVVGTRLRRRRHAARSVERSAVVG